MKKLLFTLFLLSVWFYSKGQISFQKTYGGNSWEFGYSVQQTSDSGYIITGNADSFSSWGDMDIYLIKTNINGDTLWTKTFDFGLNDDENGKSVRQAMDGGYFITGYSHSFSTGDDIFLIRTDSIGVPLWNKTYGGTNNDEGYSIQQTNDSGYVITGYTESFGAGNKDIYLIKTNANGDTLWTKTFGGALDDLGKSVQQTKDGGYIIAGETFSFSTYAKVYLIKTDANGNILWTKVMGGAILDNGGNFVQQTSDSGYIITGYAESFGAGNKDVYLIKTDSIGTPIWSKTYGGTLNDEGYCVRQTNDGGYIITGGASSFPPQTPNFDVYLIKANASGDTLWTKTFGRTIMATDYGFDVQQTNDSGYVIAGETSSFAGHFNIYLIKTDANGNSGCNQTNPPTIVATPIVPVSSPVTIVTSPLTIVTSPAIIIGCGGTVNSICGCSADFFLYADTIPHNWITVNQATGVAPLTYLWNWGDGTTSTGITPSHIYNTPGYYNICLTIADAAGCTNTYCDSSTYLYRGNSNTTVITVNVILPTSINIIEQNKNTVSISPNPSADNFIISFEEVIMKGNVEILNILGENVFAESIFNESKKEINLKDISDGIYFVKVFDGEKYYCKKIIVEQN